MREGREREGWEGRESDNVRWVVVQYSSPLLSPPSLIHFDSQRQSPSALTLPGIPFLLPPSVTLFVHVTIPTIALAFPRPHLSSVIVDNLGLGIVIVAWIDGFDVGFGLSRREEVFNEAWLFDHCVVTSAQESRVQPFPRAFSISLLCDLRCLDMRYADTN